MGGIVSGTGAGGGMVTTVLVAVPNGADPGDCALVAPESVGGICVPGVGRPVISKPLPELVRGFAVALLGGEPGEVEGIWDVGIPEMGETPGGAGALVNPGGSASVAAPFVASRPPAAFCGAVLRTERLGMLELMFGAPEAVVPLALFAALVPGFVAALVPVVPLVALVPVLALLLALAEPLELAPDPLAAPAPWPEMEVNAMAEFTKARVSKLFVFMAYG